MCKEVEDLFKLISYKSSEDRIKYYDKLYAPTYFFRAVSNDDWNKYSLVEYKLLKKDKNLKGYIVLKGANHYVWDKQEFSDIIIKTIKATLIK